LTIKCKDSENFMIFQIRHHPGYILMIGSCALDLKKNGLPDSYYGGGYVLPCAHLNKTYSAQNAAFLLARILKSWKNITKNEIS